jgi:16S rRNA (adenine1518-N6/adenine1519-N6)-dimethyltransferase
VTLVEEVPKEVFMPTPKVDSTVLRLDMRKEPPVELIDEGMFFRCVKAGFGQRRKTLLNSLQATGFNKDSIREWLKEAGIDEKRRAETLSLQDFASISNLMAGREK